LILLTAGVLAQTDPSSDRSNQVVDYEAWKAEQGMFFPTIEESYRILIFNDKAKIVQMHNADPSRTYDMAVNKFSAYSDSEFEDIFLQTRPEVSTSQEIETPQVQGRNLQGEVAPAIDWVTKGMITKIKNQGNCGSCWAFGTTAAL
jgi:cathepsin L